MKEYDWCLQFSSLTVKLHRFTLTQNSEGQEHTLLHECARVPIVSEDSQTVVREGWRAFSQSSAPVDIEGGD